MLKCNCGCWNATQSAGYRKSNADGCIYTKTVQKKNSQINFVILGVYVDDIIQVSNNTALLKTEKAALCKRFEIVDQGDIRYLLEPGK